MFIIETPLKIWGPKVKNKYTVIGYGTYIDDGIFDYKHYGHVVFNTKLDWTNHNRISIIDYDHEKCWEELKKGLKIVKNAYPELR